MTIKEIKTASESDLLKAQAMAMNAQGQGRNFSKMLENRIDKIQTELNKRKFNTFLTQDSHTFSEGHLSGWFMSQYHGKTRREVRELLEISHDNSLEIEYCEAEIGRGITPSEEKRLLNKFYKSVYSNIIWVRGVAIAWVDSIGNINN